MLQQCNIRNEQYNKVIPLYLGSQHCESRHCYGPAVRTYWLLHYVVSGRGKYRVEGHEYAVYPGEAFLIKPGEITQYEADREDPWYYIWVGFTSELPCLEELPYVIRKEGLKQIFAAVDRLRNGGILKDIQAIAAIWEVISCLCGDMAQEDDTGYAARAVNMIKKQYMKDISVQSMADALGLDRSYFSNLFKKETGKSPGRYLMEYRMERALELLRRERYSVSVVAASVGYGDLFSFSRCFKKCYGVPPSRYGEIPLTAGTTIELFTRGAKPSAASGAAV